MRTSRLETHKMAPRPNSERLAGIVDEVVTLLHDAYQMLPFSLQSKANAVTRKLSAIKRHHPRWKVRVG